MTRSRSYICLAGFAALVFALTFAPRIFPLLLKAWQPEILFSIRSEPRVLYLTIDDVPSPATDEILAVLLRHKVQATFFVIGSWVHDDAQLSRIVAAGCHLGHHMWTTEACSKLDGSRFQEQFDQNSRLLNRFEKVTYFRPPSDFVTKDELRYVREHGYEPVLGTVFPIDSSITSVPALKLMVKWLAVPGGILIMHDGRRRGYRTAQVLDEMIPYLQNQGYELKTLPEHLTSR